MADNRAGANGGANANANTTTANAAASSSATAAAAAAAPRLYASPTDGQLNPRTVEQTRAMLEAIGNYLRGELGVTLEDYRLLCAMNNATAEQYSEMAANARVLGEQMARAQAKYQELLPMLQQVDELDTNVAHLEASIASLDVYSKRLEDKVNDALSKRA